MSREISDVASLLAEIERLEEENKRLYELLTPEQFIKMTLGGKEDEQRLDR